MVTYRQLKDFDPQTLHTLARRWGNLWRKRLESRGDALLDQGKGLDWHWRGEAYEVALARFRKLVAELDLTRSPLTTIETQLIAAAEDLTTAKGMLLDVLDAAALIPATVSEDGSAITYTGELDPRQHPSVKRDIERIIAGINDALDYAERADQAAAEALRKLVPGYNPRTQNAGYVSPGDIPKPGTDPKRVNAWWDSLTPAEQQYLIHQHPERIGALDGVPVAARDQANRVVLERERERNENRRRQLADRQAELKRDLDRVSGLDPRREELQRKLAEVESELAVVDRNLKGITAIETRLYEPKPGQPPAYLIGFEPGTVEDRDGNGKPDDDGKAIIAVGNPDTADHVATYVPGTGSDLDSVGKDIERTDIMALDAGRAAGGEETSVILWLGYDAPDEVANAASGMYAENATDELRRFQDGLRATHEGPPSHNTVLGHSYGSTVIGYTAVEDLNNNGRPDGINADEVVFVGSPGVGVDYASELGMDPNHVWSTRAKWDMIRVIPDWGGYGQDPSFPEFGGRRFESDPGDPNDEKGTHSDYWLRRNKARENIAEIITDQPEKVNKYDKDR